MHDVFQLSPLMAIADFRHCLQIERFSPATHFSRHYADTPMHCRWLAAIDVISKLLLYFRHSQIRQPTLSIRCCYAIIAVIALRQLINITGQLARLATFSARASFLICQIDAAIAIARYTWYCHYDAVDITSLLIIAIVISQYWRATLHASRLADYWCHWLMPQS